MVELIIKYVLSIFFMAVMGASIVIVALGLKMIAEVYKDAKHAQTKTPEHRETPQDRARTWLLNQMGDDGK